MQKQLLFILFPLLFSFSCQPTAESYLKKALVLSESQKLDEAIVLCYQGIASYPYDPNLYMALGSLFFQIQNYDQALNHYQVAQTLDDSSFLPLLAKAHVYLALDNYNLAKEELVEALQKNPSDKRLLFLMGKTFFHLNRGHQAAGYFDQAFQAGYATADLHYYRGQVYHRFLKKYELAQQDYEKYLELSPQEENRQEVYKWMNDLTLLQSKGE